MGSIPVGRYQKFEALQAQLVWGADFDSMYKNMRRSYDLLNNGKPADAAVLINNVLEGVARHIEGREHPMLLLCSIFICLEDEDLSVWDETRAMEKITDWKLECIAVEDFFALAFSSVKGFTAHFLESLGATSELEKEETESPSLSN